MKNQQLEQKIFCYLESCNTISLATAVGGIPHAAAVFYVNIGFNLYFLSNPKSRHGENLIQNPTVSGTINEDYSNWLQIKGIQLEGRVACIGGILKHAHIVKAYVQKFPNVADFLISPHKLGKGIAQKVSTVKFYQIWPAKIYFLDNSLGFGHREELDIL
ncbi:pyridoxamine 5'-phosphate oxidase family protein [Thermodesulfobacteriota bacterium]